MYIEVRMYSFLYLKNLQEHLFCFKPSLTSYLRGSRLFKEAAENKGVFG